jgi:hypothetical protein
MRQNQQIYQLFIQFINYVWQLPHASAIHGHPQGAFLVPSERCSIEEQSTALGTLPEDVNVMPKHVGDTIHN